MVSKEIDLFFKECRLAGFNVGGNRAGTFRYVETLPTRPHPRWVCLGIDQEGRLFVTNLYGVKRFYETVEEMLESANEEINKW